MNMKRSLVVFGLTVLGVCTLDAAQFLTQAEIRARLDELYMPLSDGSICWGYRHVDRCYNTSGPFKPYEYRCPTCGESTWYREEILIGTGSDIAEYLTWARKAVEELRAMRLDVRMDERVLCATCRCELKIPDGGEIVRIPELWPAWSGRRDVFPYSVGEKVDIVSEPYRNLFGVARPGQTYWVRAKELAEAIKRKDNRLMDVYMGPDEKYTKYGRVTCWAFNCRMPEVVTNGWARYQPHDSPLLPTSFLIPKDVLGNLTYAGAKTPRTDIFTPTWAINGKRVVVWKDDVALLKRFLASEHPRDDNELRLDVRRLEQLLNPKVKDDAKTNWHPASCRGKPGPSEQLPRMNTPPCEEEDEVKVEVDI